MSFLIGQDSKGIEIMIISGYIFKWSKNHHKICSG